MTTITQVITALPTAPDPSQPDTFNVLASAFVIAQKAEVPELNTWAGQVNTVAGEVNTLVGTATTQAGISTAQAVISTAQSGIATTQAGIATTQAGISTAQAVISTAQASAASVSAAQAAASAAALFGTSTTSLLIAVGSKTFTTQAGEAYSAGNWVTATSAANLANWMYGQVISYTGTTLLVDVQVIGGSGTYADWNLSISAARGAQGPTGATGTGVTNDAIGWHATGGTTPRTLTVTADVSLAEQPPSQASAVLATFALGFI